MDVILKYFPDLTPGQILKFEKLKELYSYWNDRINVISRKDIDNIYTHHVLHSLAIGKIVELYPKQKILDVGTGGGFPGIPLSILFPESNFMLIDSIGKKIKVVREVAKQLGLKNVNAQQIRVENHKIKYDYVVSRAVTDLVKFTSWAEKNIRSEAGKETSNGILYLKGGDVEEDIKNIHYPARVIKLQNFFEEEFFETKLLVHIKISE